MVTDPTSEVEVKEICASFPYPIGPSLPQRLQEPWAALVDTGEVTSSAPALFASHVPVTPHKGQLVNVNGGEIKILGQKMVTYITHKVVVNITFLIVEDVVNPIIGLDALHQNHCYSSGLVIQEFIKGSNVPFFSGRIQSTQCLTHCHCCLSTNQIIAEIALRSNQNHV